MSAAMALCLVQYVGTDYQANLLMTATLLVVLVAQLGKAKITEALASVFREPSLVYFMSAGC